MSTSSNKFHITLRDADDESNVSILQIPNALIAELAWKHGDTLTIEKMSDGVVVISNSDHSLEQLDQEVVALAAEVFNDDRKATCWLLREHKLLGMSPLEYLNSGNSKTEVIKILLSIMHGGPV